MPTRIRARACRASFAVLLLLTAAALAQDRAGDAPAATTAQSADGASKKALADALRKALPADGFALRGVAIERTPESGGGGAVVVGGGASAAEFRGEFEVATAKDGSMTARSKRRLPGFVLYRRDDRTITQTTVEDEGLSVTATATDLAAVLDRDRLALAVERSEVTVETQGPAKVFALKLPRSFVRGGAAGPMAAFAPKVIRADAEVRVEAGAVTAIRLSVVRSDPLAGMRSRMPAGGAAEFHAPPEDDGTAEGATRRYELTPAPAPSAELRGAAEAMRQVFDDV